MQVEQPCAIVISCKNHRIMSKKPRYYPPESGKGKIYCKITRFFDKTFRYSSDSNFKMSIDQQRKTAYLLYRLKNRK